MQAAKSCWFSNTPDKREINIDGKALMHCKQHEGMQMLGTIQCANPDSTKAVEHAVTRTIKYINTRKQLFKHANVSRTRKLDVCCKLARPLITWGAAAAIINDTHLVTINTAQKACERSVAALPRSASECPLQYLARVNHFLPK